MRGRDDVLAKLSTIYQALLDLNGKPQKKMSKKKRAEHKRAIEDATALVKSHMDQFKALLRDVQAAINIAPAPKGVSDEVLAKRAEGRDPLIAGAVRHLAAHWGELVEHLPMLERIACHMAEPGVELGETKEDPAEVLKNLAKDSPDVVDCISVGFGKKFGSKNVPEWISDNPAFKDIVDATSRSDVMNVTYKVELGVEGRRNGGSVPAADTYVGHRRAGDKGALVCDALNDMAQKSKYLLFSLWYMVEEGKLSKAIRLGTAYFMDPAEISAKKAVGQGFDLFAALGTWETSKKAEEVVLGRFALEAEKMVAAIESSGNVFALGQPSAE